MNMSSEKGTDFSRQLTEFLAFRDDEERIEFQAELLHLELMDQIQEMMDTRGWNKADLAKHLGTSKSYITQLFTADKLLNLKMIVKLRKLFDCRISCSFTYEDSSELARLAPQGEEYWKNTLSHSTSRRDWRHERQDYTVSEIKENVYKLEYSIGA